MSTQTRLGSAVETIVGTTIGFFVAWLANWALWRLFGMRPTVGESFWVAVMFTVLSLGRVYFVRRLFARDWWEHWVSSYTHTQPVMWIAGLVHLFGCRIDLHKFVHADAPGVFHTHPAWAIRVVLWGGYVEEVRHEVCCAVNDLSVEVMRVKGLEYYKPNEECCGAPEAVKETVRWEPGRVGIVRPELCHRIDELLEDCSISLWIRGPIVRDIDIVDDNLGTRHTVDQAARISA